MLAINADIPRYAIYFAPEATSPLWRFGSTVIGYDAASGADVPFAKWIKDVPDWATITAEPRHYGFHAPLKAPFHLVTSIRERDLTDRLGALARRHRAFGLGALEVRLLDHFAALVLPSQPAALAALAADCVQSIDEYRAPLTHQDLQRRLAAPLTQRQRSLLDRWGYPYVFDEFRFHLTLTGRLSSDPAPKITELLRRAYFPIEDTETFSAITLFRQENRSARFRIIKRFALGTAE